MRNERRSNEIYFTEAECGKLDVLRGGKLRICCLMTVNNVTNHKSSVLFRMEKTGLFD